MKKRTKICVIVLISIVVIAGALFLANAFSHDSNRQKPLSVERISDTKFALYLSDTRESDDLPVEMKISFSVDKNNHVLQDTLKETHQKKYDEDYGYVYPTVRNKTAKVVYVVVIAYEYQFSAQVNLETLEILSADEERPNPLTVEKDSEQSYQLRIKDTGYDEKTSLDIEILFSVDDKGMIQEDTIVSKNLLEMEDKKEKISTYLDNTNSGEIYLSVVARNYDLIAKFDCDTLEVLSYEVLRSTHY